MTSVAAAGRCADSAPICALGPSRPIPSRPVPPPASALQQVPAAVKHRPLDRPTRFRRQFARGTVVAPRRRISVAVLARDASAAASLESTTTSNLIDCVRKPTTRAPVAADRPAALNAQPGWSLLTTSTGRCTF